MSFRDAQAVQQLPDVSPSEFRTQLYEKYEGDNDLTTLGSLVDDVWPVGLVDGEPVLRDGTGVEPSYREHQRNAVIEMLNKLYLEGNDVCLLSAPTGSGKSILIYAMTRAAWKVFNGRSFVTTPLNALISQIQTDDLLDEVLTIKGRSNYQCIHPEDKGTPVDEAICQRQDDFDCQYKDMSHEIGGCFYYGRKKVAETRPNVVTNLSFLMSNSLIPDEVDAGLSSRQQMAVDEAHSIENFAISFIGFTVSDRTVPIDWEDISKIPSEDDSMEDTIEWLRNEVLLKAIERKEELESRSLLSPSEQETKEEVTRWIQKVTAFLEDVKDNHWVKTHDKYGGSKKIEFKPIFIKDFMEKFLWSQCNKVVCASATIPPNFVDEVGLGDRDVGRVDVPSTFPPERRPVITDRAVGKMTMSERDKTIPQMADEIAQIANEWRGHSGIVHAHSYKMAERLYDRLPRDVRDRTRLQDGDNREKSLEDWVDAPVDETGQYRDTGGQVFMSVGMEEGIDLADDAARFNIISKCPYPYLGDERVSYRVNEMDDWEFYAKQPITLLQQASGRTMRSPDDWSITYILDTSAVGLIDRNRGSFETWFLESIDIDYDRDVVSPDS